MRDDFFTKTKCDRCHGDFNGCRTMSMFNTQVICMACKEKEQQRADYLTFYFCKSCFPCRIVWQYNNLSCSHTVTCELEVIVSCKTAYISIFSSDFPVDFGVGVGEAAENYFFDGSRNVA